MKKALQWTFFSLGLGLGVTELVALLNGGAGDTATELVHALPWWGRALVALFCAWLTVHFGFEILPAPRRKPSAEAAAEPDSGKPATARTEQPYSPPPTYVESVDTQEP